MRTRQLILGSGIAFAIVLTIFFAGNVEGSSYGAHAQSQIQSQGNLSLGAPTPDLPKKKPQIYPNSGLPAIVPSTKPDQTSAKTNTVRITANDVRMYLAKHPFPGGVTTSGSAPTVHRISFVTSKEAYILTKGEATGLADTAMVAYVELKGPFVLSNISVPAGYNKPFPTFNIGVEVFNAENGNLLMIAAHN